MNAGVPKTAMDFSGVASKFSVPSAPGHVGGAPMVHPSGEQVGAGLMDSEKLKMPQGGGGSPLDSGQNPLNPPPLVAGNFGPFQPFAFDRFGYGFRRGMMG